MTRWFFAVPALATSLLAFTITGSAQAFCQANSCEPSRGEVCFQDENTCLAGGLPLSWRSNCVTFTVQRDGSKLNGIEASDFESTIDTAFQTWMTADCGEATHPSISVSSLGQVECSNVEYNTDQGNANIYLFRDDEWTAISEDVLALTTTSYDWKTGEIYDADVEVNGTAGNITNTEPEAGADLLSIITHESGHFLGLAHSQFPDTTMRARYTPQFDNLRVLAQDDIDGICTVYPADREVTKTECTPRHGFSSSCRKEESGCDCAVTPGRPSNNAAWLLFGVTALGALSRRRRRAAR